MKSESQRVFGLDFLRAWAILFVLIAHTHLAAGSTQGKFAGMLGFYGVELFFVLSGFLIGGILMKSVTLESDFQTLSGFWIRRWFRTLPNYFLFLILCLLLYPALQAYSGFISTEHWPRYFVFLQNFASANPEFFPESWSLAIEEWFYLLFPPVFLMLCKKTKAPDRSFIFTALIFLFGSLLMRFKPAFDAAAQFDADVRKVVIYRLDSLMFGVIAAFIAERCPAVWKKYGRPALGTGLTLFVLFFVFLYIFEPYQKAWAKILVFPVVSLSFAFLLPFFSEWKKTELPFAGLFHKIALWSYSLYLCHFLVALIFRALSGQGKIQVFIASDWAFRAVYWACCFAVAAIVYTCYERPLMNLREKFR